MMQRSPNYVGKRAAKMRRLGLCAMRSASFRTELEAMRKSVQGQEAQVGKAQEKTFEQTDEDTWIMGDDSTIPNDFG